MKKRKILLVTGNFPPGIGGMQSYYHHLCKNSKHDVTVLAPHYPDDEAFDVQQPYKIIRGHFFENERVHISSWPGLFRKTKKVIQEEKIDVTIYGYILIGFIGWILNVFMGKPYMISTHGKDMLEFKKIPILHLMTKMILKRASGILTNSEYTKKLVEGYGVESSKIQLIYPGVEEGFEIEEKSPELIAKHGLEGKYVMITVGRLVRRKGHDMVIEALPKILNRIPNAVYLIVGDGPERERLEQLAEELGVSSHVVFAGRAGSLEMLNKYYNLADQFIMTSRHLKLKGDVEGFGIVYLEAASCGAAVIAGNSGGVAEAVLHEETGLLVDPNNEDEIVEAVVRLHDDPAYKAKLAEKAYHRAKTQFNYAYLAGQLDEYLTKHCKYLEQIKGLSRRQIAKQQSNPRFHG